MALECGKILLTYNAECNEMKKLFIIMMFVSSYAIADSGRIYEKYGYGSRYNPQVVYPDNVQLYIMQQQAEKARKSYEDNAVRQGLKDSLRSNDYYEYRRFKDGY